MREAVSKVEALQRSKTQGISLDDVERGVAQATRALIDLAHDDGHICFELEADATIPSEYVLFHHFRGTQVPDDLEAKIGSYLRRTQGRHGGWALVHEGPFDMSCTVKAYFALKMIGDDIEAPHMRRAREGDPVPRRRRQRQRLHPLHAGALRRGAVARRAGDARGGDVPAEVVPVPSRQDQLLGPHHRGAALRAPGDQAPGAQPARHRRAGAVRHAAGERAHLAGLPACHVALDADLRLHRPDAAEGREPHAAQEPAARHGDGPRLGQRAPERRGWPGGDLPRHGQFGADVRGDGLPARSSAGPRRLRRHREARGREGRRGLRPALRLAGLGYGPRQPCAAGGRRPRGRGPGPRRSRLAQAPPGARHRRRLGGAQARRSVRAAGPSSTPTPIIPTSTTPPSW